MNKYILSIIAALLVSAFSGRISALTVGADRPELYLAQLKGKRVALYSNHTGLRNDGRHTLDHLLEAGVDVKYLFSPEHGFRGTADAGAHVKGGIDPETGVRVLSLYGKGKKQALAYVDSVDVVMTDIQDVGLRFYTYYCTMLELMNAALPGNKEFIILDRPNPTSPMGVDGPVLDMKYRSGVGRLPIPVLHGMTLGELATMASGEGWLDKGGKSRLTVIPCEGYTHATRYELPVPPSPNLPNIHAIYLYPSMCYFEATPLSLGRGTDSPFEVYGHPSMKSGEYTFTPRSRQGATKPPLLDRRCRGVDLRRVPSDTLIARGVDLTYLIDAYDRMGRPKDFFTSFFELLIGNGNVRRMIESGATASEIKATWREEARRFELRRRPYLLYPMK
ncbi:MAG: DUF1343 domain-containing protein [Clostridiales bacterium]|nr:DUF1343 domain-containing protein [Clostridiales bacterium]